MQAFEGDLFKFSYFSMSESVCEVCDRVCTLCADLFLRMRKSRVQKPGLSVNFWVVASERFNTENLDI